MGWGGAVEQAIAAIRDLWKRKYGNQTTQQSALEDEADHWARRYRDALSVYDLEQANLARLELERVRRKLAAIRPLKP